jgi:hypothetical protein
MSEDYLQPNHNNLYIPTGSPEHMSYCWYPQGAVNSADATRHPCWWDMRNIKDLKEGTYLLPPEFRINVLAYTADIPFSPELDARYEELVAPLDRTPRGREARWREAMYGKQES